MDFDQWKPLTGRGDPLRNDPTYDYEPPVLERVHYWADDTRPDPTPPKPERKSEVLVLGVSSRKPSVTPRQPLKHHHRPPPPKYEDYSYKLSQHYPMTILVPPPPPPPGHQQPIYLLSEEKLTTPHKIKPTEAIAAVTEDPTHLTSLYALQEANLIYQASTVSQNWFDTNHTGPFVNSDISSDYSGWGPTTPLTEKDVENETQNFIFNEQFDVSKHPFSFYRPMLSEAPPPPRVTPNPLMLPTFVPTALPIVSTTRSTPVIKSQTSTEGETTTTNSPFIRDYDETTTEQNNIYQTTPEVTPLKPKPEATLFDMMGPMMSMPMVNGPERPQDHLYAFASENLHIYREHKPMDDIAKLESMQTMQPPPPTNPTESAPTKSDQAFKINPNIINNLLYKDKFKTNVNDPYIQSQLTTQMPTIAPMIDVFEDIKSTPEPNATPMYLIIQGHSKVKSYSSKSKPADSKESKDKDSSKQKGTQQVKHLHPIKEKHSSKKVEKIETDRAKYSKNLKALISDGVGTIDVQETKLGIKYDVSDGSDVPVEIYKKGIVESDENDYSTDRKKVKRTKRHILEHLINGYVNGDTLDEFLYNYLNSRKHESGFTGFVAKAITSKAADVLDDLDNDEEDEYDEDDDEYR